MPAFDLTTEEGRKAFDEYRFNYIHQCSIEHSIEQAVRKLKIEQEIEFIMNYGFEPWMTDIPKRNKKNKKNNPFRSHRR